MFQLNVFRECDAKKKWEFLVRMQNIRWCFAFCAHADWARMKIRATAGAKREKRRESEKTDLYGYQRRGRNLQYNQSSVRVVIVVAIQRRLNRTNFFLLLIAFEQIKIYGRMCCKFKIETRCVCNTARLPYDTIDDNERIWTWRRRRRKKNLCTKTPQ